MTNDDDVYMINVMTKVQTYEYTFYFYYLRPRIFKILEHTLRLILNTRITSN